MELNLQERKFLQECDLWEHSNNALKIMGEDFEGAYLDKEDIKKLIEVLTKYISDEKSI